MNRLKPYPKYKPSGVEWLGDVPEHWGRLPIKYTALDSGSLFLDGDWIESKDTSDDGIRYITTGNVGAGKYKEQGSGYITEDKFRELNCTDVFEGDILISRLNAPIGRACIVPNLGSRIVTSVDNVIYRPDSIFHKQYMVHLFSCDDYFKHTSDLARGATMQRISRGLLSNIRIITPPNDEQSAIATFLDRETTRIDALVEKKQRFIELLKEKRQTLITDAVTGKFDVSTGKPYPKYKPSGVDWLGDVPEHWNVIPVKRVFMVLGGSTPKSAVPDNWGGDVVWVTPADLSKLPTMGIYGSARMITPKGLASCGANMVPSGSIVLSTRAPIGSMGIAKTPLCTNQGCKSLVPFGINNTGFYAHFFTVSSDQLNVRGKGTTFLELSGDELGAFEVISPPSDEQSAIATFLDRETTRIDALVEKTKQSIKLLKERRAALITAAVTGKVDVREVA